MTYSRRYNSGRVFCLRVFSSHSFISRNNSQSPPQIVCWAYESENDCDKYQRTHTDSGSYTKSRIAWVHATWGWYHSPMTWSRVVSSIGARTCWDCSIVASWLYMGTGPIFSDHPSQDLQHIRSSRRFMMPHIRVLNQGERDPTWEL